MSSQKPSVSIVVATRDEPLALRTCLDALSGQTYKCEVLVADGGTGSVARDLAHERGIRWIENPERIAATGWNLGIEATSGEIVGIMSSHAVPEPDYVERCVAALQRTGAWAVGGRIVRMGGAGPTQEAIARATSSPFGVGNARHNYSSTPGWEESVFPGMWPRWVLERVGTFDPELVRNQDDELSFRIRQAGGQIWYDPSIVVAYEPRKTLARVFEQYRQYGYWKVRVYEKHPGSVRPRQLVPALSIAAVSAGLLGFITGGSIRWVFAPAPGLYALYVCIAGLSLGGVRLAPRIAAALAAIHAGYGIGMWQGAAQWFLRRRRASWPIR